MKKTLLPFVVLIGNIVQAQFASSSPAAGNFFTSSTTKLGIGTGVLPTTTSATLEVAGETKFTTGNVELSNRYSKLNIGNPLETVNGVLGNGYIRGDDDSYLKLFLYHPSYVRLSNSKEGSNFEKGLVVNNNRIGINVFNPTDMLHVNLLGSSARFDVSNEGLAAGALPHRLYMGLNNKLGISFIPNTSGNAWFHIHQTLKNTLQISTGNAVGDAPLVTFNGNGQVGIGTTTPYVRSSNQDYNAKLDVAGNIKASSFWMNGGADFIMSSQLGNTTDSRGYIDPESANPGRALVRDGNKTLVVNYGNDFTGGVRIMSNVNIDNLLKVNKIGINTASVPSNYFMKVGGPVMIGENVPNTAIDAVHALSVDGKIVARELVAVTDQSGWRSFPDYVFEKDYKLMSLDSLQNYIVQYKHLPEIPTAKEVEKNGIGLASLAVQQMKKIEELTLYILEQEKRLKALEAKLK